MTFGGKDNRGPSIAELQRYVREQTLLIFMLANGNELVGKLRWFDENAFQIVPDGEEPLTILRSAILGYQRKGGGSTKSSAGEAGAAASKD